MLVPVNPIMRRIVGTIEDLFHFGLAISAEDDKRVSSLQLPHAYLLDMLLFCETDLGGIRRALCERTIACDEQNECRAVVEGTKRFVATGTQSSAC